MVRIRLASFSLTTLIVVAACMSTRPPATYPVLPTFPVPPETLASPVGSIPPDFGKATWAEDPSFAAPTEHSVELHILVWESACSGGAPATGRISPPVVDYGPTAVTITLGVRPFAVPSGYLVTCPGPPGTPAILVLGEPLGSRQLLDGGCAPAVVRASPALLGPGCNVQ